MSETSTRLSPLPEPDPQPSEAVLEFESRAAHLVMERGTRRRLNAVTEMVLYLPCLKITGNVQVSCSLGAVGVGELNAVHEFVAFTQLEVMETGVPFNEVYYKTTRGPQVEVFRWDDKLIEKHLPQLQAYMVLDDLSSI